MVSVLKMKHFVNISVDIISLFGNWILGIRVHHLLHLPLLAAGFYVFR